MKKIISILFLLSMSVIAFSQSHLKIAGVEISGDVRSFANVLQEKGYKLVGFGTHGAILTGDFTARPVRMVVMGTEKTNTVFSAVVKYAAYDEWLPIKNIYTNVKENLTNKYGEPVISNEYFLSPFKEGDGRESLAIQLGNVSYKTLYLYKINGESIGEILLSIECEDDKAFVQLTYLDTAGGKIRKAELSSIADNDL